MSRYPIEKKLPVLSSNDKIESSLALIKLNGFGALPVVDNQKLSAILSLHSPELSRLSSLTGKAIKELSLQFPPSLYEESHPYQAVKLISQTGLGFLPVVNENQQYLGVVLHRDILEELSKVFSLSNIHHLIEIEIPAGAFKLSDLVKLLEQNETRVISLATTQSHEFPDTNLITLNVESRDAFRLQKTLERYGYHVTYNSQESEILIDDASFRAQELMRYLEI
ncbi:MAG: CBS domain-containing protein [Chloroherpetonaceae bacterium]|nr:CBS domain-containing protein [Chloroherpetonaceae bacterium]